MRVFCFVNSLERETVFGRVRGLSNATGNCILSVNSINTTDLNISSHQMVSEQFDSGRMITQFDDLEECEDLEYVEEKLVKIQERCGSINNRMQKMIKMLDKISHSLEETHKRTLKRSVRSDSVEKDNPDLYSKPDLAQKEKNRGDTKRIQSILNFKREDYDEEENDKELQRETTGERSSDHLFKNRDKNWTKIAIDIKPDREEKYSQVNPAPETNLNPQSDQNPNLKLHRIPDPYPYPYPNPKSDPSPYPDPSPDPYPVSNPSLNPYLDPILSPDPYPKLNLKPDSNLNMKLGLSSAFTLVLDEEAIEGEHSDNEGDEETEGESKIKRDRDLKEEIEVPSPYLPLLPFPPLQRDPPLNNIKVRIRNSCKSIKPNLYNRLNLLWPWPIQVGTTRPKSRKYFNGSAKYKPSFTIWATTQGVWLGNGRGKLPIPIPPPPLPIPPQPPPCAIEVYREWFQRKFQFSFCSRTHENLCEASVNVYSTIHLFNENDNRQIKRDEIMWFVLLLIYPQFSIVGFRSLLIVPKYIEEALQELKVEPVLKGNGSFMAEQFGVRKSRWWQENNGGRFFGTKDTSVLRWDLKPEWKGLSFLEVNWEDYVRGSQEFNVFFWNLASKEKGSGLTKHQVKKFTGWYKDETDRFHGMEATSYCFSTARAWWGDDHRKPLPPPLPPPLPTSIVDRMLLNRCFHFFTP